LVLAVVVEVAVLVGMEASPLQGLWAVVVVVLVSFHQRTCHLRGKLQLLLALEVLEELQ
jgi:hypothetical protein